MKLRIHGTRFAPKNTYPKSLCYFYHAKFLKREISLLIKEQQAIVPCEYY